MIPQYVRQVAPDRRGQQLAGLGARAQSQVGAVVGGLGARMTARGEEMVARGDALAASRAWRQIDEWRIGYLRQLPDRRKDLSASQIHPVSGTNVTGYEMELDAFPNAMAEQMQRVSQGLSASARARLQMSYDDASPRWAQEVATVLDRMEISDVVVEARGLAREGRAASGLDLVDLYRDRLDPDDYEKLTAELRLTGAQSDLQEIARFDGWEKARQTLQDPQWQQIYGLDVAEAAAVRNQLAGFVAEEAGIAESRQRAVVEKNSDEYLVAAERGEADLEAGLEAVRRNELPYEVYRQARQIMAEPRSQNDPDVYEQLVEMQDLAARGAIPGADVKSFLRQNASKLTPATRQAATERMGSPFSMQTQAKNDAVQRAYGQFVRVQEDDPLKISLAGGDMSAIRAAGDARAQQLNLVNMLSDELEEWIQKNPDATRAEILRQGRMIQVQIGQRAIEEQDSLIRQWEASAGGMPGPEAAGVAGNLGNLRKTQTSAVPQSSAPAGLESIWDQLDSEAKADVMRLLARGRTAEDILRIWQENP